MLALVVEHAVGEALGDYVQRLLKHWSRLLVRYVVEGEFDGRDAPANAEFEPAPGQVVQHAYLLGQPEGVVYGQQVDQRA